MLGQDQNRRFSAMTGSVTRPGQSHILSIPSRSFYRQRRRQRRHSHAHSHSSITVACKHVVSRDNYSNFNGIQCKRQLIMYYVVPDEACTAWVSVRDTAHTK